MKVLVIDDSKFQRTSIVKNITSLGVECTEASNGVEGLSKLEQDTFDCVVTDIHMPEMNGFEVLKTIKASEKFKHLPVLVMTADIQKETFDELMNLGACGMLSKPVKPASLTDAMKKILKLP